MWFTEKDHDGATRLFPLADLSPRTDEAIERRYRTGRYGATPILTTEEFAEAALNAAGERRYVMSPEVEGSLEDKRFRSTAVLPGASLRQPHNARVVAGTTQPAPRGRWCAR